MPKGRRCLYFRVSRRPFGPCGQGGLLLQPTGCNLRHWANTMRPPAYARFPILPFLQSSPLLLPPLLSPCFFAFSFFLSLNPSLYSSLTHVALPLLSSPQYVCAQPSPEPHCCHHHTARKIGPSRVSTHHQMLGDWVRIIFLPSPFLTCFIFHCAFLPFPFFPIFPIFAAVFPTFLPSS